MRTLDLQSEAYQATGSISADGIKNQLGRPRLDRLTLLARESVQNSWDARLADRGVSFGMSGWNLTGRQRSWLLETMFHKTPPQGLDLLRHLEGTATCPVLAVYDRGTRGLCGPTRADQVSSDEPSNFVNLLRNVGQPPAAFRGGGTYGFGKTALFLAGQARTIIAHTQVASGRRFEQRLIGAALGSQYTLPGGKLSRGSRRFTGRHWWGRKDGNVVDPLTGREAADAARAIGLPPFEREETGTTILILLPDFEGRQPEEALRYIGEAILRSFWPKMIDGSRGGASMTFDLSWDGKRIPMPRPQEVPPLNSYVKAFVNLQAKLAGKQIPHPGGRIQEVHSQRPARHLGTLSLFKFPPEPRLASSGDDDGQGPFQSKSHHTALMRGPHFVVTYLEGPTMPFELAEYAGIFLTSVDVEEAYARSEPPTHDAWVPDVLDDKNEKRLVNIGLKKIKEGMQEFAGVSTPDRVPGQSVPLGGFSDLLGGLIPAEVGTGARGGSAAADDRRGDGSLDGRGGSDGSSGGVGGAGGGVRTFRARIVETGEPDTIAGSSVPVFTVRFEVDPAVRPKHVVVSARAGVVLEDGTMEADPPAGAARPEVLFWSSSGGKVMSRSNTLQIGPNDQGPWSVAVAMPEDAAVAVELEVEAAR